MQKSFFRASLLILEAVAGSYCCKKLFYKFRKVLRKTPVPRISSQSQSTLLKRDFSSFFYMWILWNFQKYGTGYEFENNSVEVWNSHKWIRVRVFSLQVNHPFGVEQKWAALKISGCHESIHGEVCLSSLKPLEIMSKLTNICVEIYWNSYIELPFHKKM